MEEINKRILALRKELKLNQGKFGDGIGLSTSGISSIESGTRSVSEKHIKLICNEYRVNEEWLRTGTEEMFTQTGNMTLDAYAEKNKLTPLETDIIKGYMELDSEVRKGLISHFKNIFNRHPDETAVAKENDAGNVEKVKGANFCDDIGLDTETQAKLEEEIEAEGEKFKLEYAAEKRAQILSVLPNLSGKID